MMQIPDAVNRLGRIPGECQCDEQVVRLDHGQTVQVIPGTNTAVIDLVIQIPKGGDEQRCHAGGRSAAGDVDVLGPVHHRQEFRQIFLIVGVGQGGLNCGKVLLHTQGKDAVIIAVRQLSGHDQIRIGILGNIV